jgi:hypothetical protein
VSTQTLELVDELEQLESQKTCRASFHPRHEHCGAPATYAIVWTCPICGTRPHYMCVAHLSGYVDSYIHNGKWCPCKPHDPPHAISAVIVRGL